MFKIGDIVQYLPKMSFHSMLYPITDSYAHGMSISNDLALDEAFSHMVVIDIIHNGETDADRVFPWTNKSGHTVYVTKIDKPNTYPYYFKEDELILVKSSK